MMNKKKAFGLAAGLVAVAVLIILLLSMCSGGRSESPQTTQPQQTEATGTTENTEEPTDATVETTEPTEATEATEETEATEATEETTEPTEEATEPATGGSSTPGGTSGYNPTPDLGEDEEEDEEEEKIEIPEPGSENNPYFEVLSAVPTAIRTVKIPTDSPISYEFAGASDSILTIEDADASIVYGENTYTADETGVITVDLTDAAESVMLKLSNGSGAEKALVLQFGECPGGKTNPVILESLEQIDVKLEAGDEDGCYYQWTSADNGSLTLAADSSLVDVIITVNGESVKLSDSEDGTVTAEIAEGDEVTIQVVAKPDANGEYPETETTVTGTVEALKGTEENPYTEQLAAVPGAITTPEIPAGTNVYYNIYGAGDTTLTIEAPNGFVIYNGVTYGADANGVITLDLASGNPMMPAVLQVGNAGENAESYTMNFAYPVGHQMNPAQLVIGANTAELESGDTDGWFYTWTAEEDGDLTITVNTELTSCGWMYTVNNQTANVYGDTHWSDDDPLVGSETIAVTAGDVVVVTMNTYDPADMWNNPQGTVVIDAWFEKELPPLGSEENPIWIQDVSVPTGTTVGAGETLYYSGYLAETTMTIENASGATVAFNGQSYTADDQGVITVTFPAAAGMGRPMPEVFTITSTAASDYTLTFAYPEGHAMNPAELQLGENKTAIAEADPDGCYYTWTAEEQGILSLTLAAESGWQYTLNNVTSGTYGDAQYSDSDPVVNPAELEVAAGDEIQLIVSTYDPENPWSAPAGELTVTAEFTSTYGTEENPIWILDVETPTTIQIQEGQTLYCTGYIYDMTMTVENAKDLTVTFSGQSYTADENGILTVEFPAAQSMGRPNPVEFTVTGGADGDYALSFAYPDGHQMNPAELQIGENTAVLEAADSDGYFYTWTAPEKGTLTITMPGDTGWFYTLNNLTTSVYGENQYSNADPVANPAQISVEEGNEIQLIVNTFDPADSWNTPAGELVIQAAFAPTRGSAEEPIWITDVETPTQVSLQAGQTLYYTGYIYDMTMTVENAKDLTVTFNGQSHTAGENGVLTVEFPAAQSMGRPNPVEFTVTGGTDADYTLSFAYPDGHQMNPAGLQIGENTAVLEAADSDGYFYTWTAPEKGTLTITMPGDTGWFYTLNNLTTYTYGDNQYSNADPVANPAQLSVEEGDEIQLIVNTFDPADAYNAPGGTLVVHLAFEAVQPVVLSVQKDNRICFTPTEEWMEKEARFAVCFLKDEEEIWVDMVLDQENEKENLYVAEAPEEYDHLIFCALDPETKKNEWKNVWKQTEELEAEGNHFILFEKPDEDKKEGKWETIQLKLK